MNRLKHIILMILLSAGAFVLLGSAIARQEDRQCERFDVTFVGESVLDFVIADEVEQRIRDRGDAIIGQPMSDIHTEQISALLSTDPYIKSVTVYKTIDLGMDVIIEQRKPIFRFISDRGVSGYVDADGYYMPLKKGYAPKLIPVTGNLPIGRSAFEGGHVSDTPEMKAIWEMMTDIGRDDFWSSQFVQIDVDPAGEVTAIPRVGNHVILLGAAGGHEAKLARLKAFYDKGVSQTNWNIYESINVKYEDQVVCKKRQYN